MEKAATSAYRLNAKKNQYDISPRVPTTKCGRSNLLLRCREIDPAGTVAPGQ